MKVSLNSGNTEGVLMALGTETLQTMMAPEAAQQLQRETWVQLIKDTLLEAEATHECLETASTRLALLLEVVNDSRVHELLQQELVSDLCIIQAVVNVSQSPTSLVRQAVEKINKHAREDISRIFRVLNIGGAFLKRAEKHLEEVDSYMPDVTRFLKLQQKVKPVQVKKDQEGIEATVQCISSETIHEDICYFTTKSANGV